MKLNIRSRWLAVTAALSASGLLAACAASSTTEDTTTTVSQALETTSNASDAVEAAALMRGLPNFRNEASEGFHCDDSPDVTTVDVCGKSLPATVHLEWTDCAAPERPGKGDKRGPGGGEHGGPPGDADGGIRPPPPLGGHPGGPPPGDADGGMRPPPGGEGPHGGPRPPPADGGVSSESPRHGPSSGVVDITNTYTPAADCSSIAQEQSVTFSISRTGADGSVSKVAGTTSSSSELSADAPPRRKATQVDVKRTLTDSAGAELNWMTIKGSTSVAFSADTPPTRTLNGSFEENFSDGTQGTVAMTDVVQPPRNVCAWPTSGTLARTLRSGASHTLVYGPDCGDATLDGTAVDLSLVRPSKGPGGHGGK